MANSGVKEEAQKSLDGMKNKDWRLAVDLLLLLALLWLLNMISK